MTSRLRNRPAPRVRAARPIDGVLARLVVSGMGWVGTVPPAPADHRVTVSFSATPPAVAHSDRLEAIGYRIAGIQPLSCLCSPGSLSCWAGHSQSLGVHLADFLVPRAAATEHPLWWRALEGRAHRLFRLSFGPVLVALEETLAVHAPDDWAGGSV